MAKKIEAIIEIPRGAANKYELDQATGEIHLKKVHSTAVRYPVDYGFIPGTCAEDGDPLDVMVLVEEPTFPGCHMTVRPVGLLCMRDKQGADNKVLAVPEADPRFNSVQDLSDIEPHKLKEIENFFVAYKGARKNSVDINSWENRAVALKSIDKHSKLREREQ
jgi:inorganic pyrophosphatase